METITIDAEDARKLLGASSGDAALLYIFIRGGGVPAEAEQALGISSSRLSCAAATLRQLGLWPEERKTPVLTGQRPDYSEKDVTQALDSDNSFRLLYGEVQRLLGRNLNTEELKILLSFVRYLGLPSEVISVLVSYCKDRARQKGSLRNPSLRTIEKEAYHWAEEGIDTLEEAAAYTRQQNLRLSQVGRIMQVLQIRGRNLTAPESRYIQQWLEIGFDEQTIGLAYEKSCLNTGGLAWPYMNKILQSWHAQNLHTVQQVQQSDRKPSVPRGGELGDAELAAIQRLMKEG